MGVRAVRLVANPDLGELPSRPLKSVAGDNDVSMPAFDLQRSRAATEPVSVDRPSPGSVLSKASLTYLYKKGGGFRPVLCVQGLQERTLLTPGLETVGTS